MREKRTIDREIIIDNKHYWLHEEIGSGAYGKVYRATQLSDQKLVAIKVFRDDVHSYMKEVTILGKLRHQNIVSLLHSGVWQGDFEQKFCIVMPHIQGQNLRDFCYQKNPIKLRLILELVIQTARAISYAHNFAEGRVVHRDLKPENILIDEQGHLYILDFGIARLIATDQTRLTNSLGGERGTPDYMAPEQLLNEIDNDRYHLCDVWALGVILFELIEGVRPFRGDNYLTLGNAITNNPVPPLKRVHNPELQRIINKALSKRASDRYHSVDEFADALSQYYRHKYRQIFIRKVGTEPLWRQLAPTSYQNNKSWPIIYDNIQKCAHLPAPLLPPKLVVIGNQKYPAEVWLAYQQPQGERLREVRPHLQQNDLITLTRTITTSMQIVREQGLRPKVPDRWSIYWSQQAGWEILAEEWAYVSYNSTPEVSQMIELLKYAAEENLPRHWKSFLNNPTAYNIQQWQEQFEKEVLNQPTLPDKREIITSLLEGPELKAHEMAKQVVEAFWSDSTYLQDIAGEILPLMRRREGKNFQSLVELIYDPPKDPSKIIHFWEFPLPPSQEKQKVWLIRANDPLDEIVEAIHFDESQAEIITETPEEPQAIPDFQFLHQKTITLSNQTIILKEYRHIPTQLDFVLLPGGEFIMGCRENKQNSWCSSCEFPPHKVRLRPFLISKTPVTQAAWQRVMNGDNPSLFEGEQRPVENISWEECQHFCQKNNLHLPSEAQWEYACRAGTTTRFYWGDHWDRNQINSASYWANQDLLFEANEEQALSQATTTEVGQFPPNPFGLFDMLGNVWEWCQDTWSEDYQQTPYDGQQAREKSEQKNRVCRGGCYWSCARDCRSTHRFWGDPSTGCWDLGFRVVSNDSSCK